MSETQPVAPATVKVDVPLWLIIIVGILCVAVAGLITTALLAPQAAKAVPPTPPALVTVSIQTFQNAPARITVKSSSGVSSQQTSNPNLTRTLTDVPVGSTVEVQIAAYSQLDEDEIQVGCVIRVGDKAVSNQVSNGQQSDGIFPAASCIATIA